MRPVLTYKPLSETRLATLDLPSHATPYLRKRKALLAEREHERLRLAQVDRETHKYGQNVESRYRMKKGEYLEILKRQNHACVTCNRPEADFIRRLHVDHNHTTGKVRGILCPSCNTILGKCNENPNTLRHLAAYLEYHHSLRDKE